jgi:hypothetical protein
MKYPSHDKPEDAFASPGIKFLFDCHSLNGIGLKDAPDSGKKNAKILF